MKKAVGLYEKNDTGKTQTLNLLIDLLTVETSHCEMPQPQKIGVNRKQYFSYKGFIVGVCTAGDNQSELISNCEFFKKYNCDFVFSATRKRSDSLSVIYYTDFTTKNGFDLEWVEKAISTKDHESINLRQAQELLEMIK